MSGDIKVDGLTELERALRALPALVSKRLINSATRSGAMVVRREARKLVPKRTGVLRKNLLIKRGRRSNTSAVYSIGWGKDGYYGRFLELGTQHMPARPHLRPAIENHQREVMEKIRVILWRGIVRASRKYVK